MLEVIKAALNTTTSAQSIRQDLSSVISLTDEYERPITTDAPQVPASSTTHEWNEQGMQSAGFTVYASGGATFSEGGTPAANAKAMVRKQNVCCEVGRLAQVTDRLAATWTQGGQYSLAAGEDERMMLDALDYATALVTQEVLNQVEFMHVAGDSVNTEALEGGQTDGLWKWAVAGGTVVVTGGTSQTPVNMAEQFLKDGGRSQALAFASVKPNRALVAPELIPDINSYIANGAGRPIVQIATGDNSGLVAGQDVGWYNTGFSKLEIKEEPFLSPTVNAHLSNPGIIAYRTGLVKTASLQKLAAEPLARVGKSVQRMVTIDFAQEHRVAKHTFVIQNVKSAIA